MSEPEPFSPPLGPKRLQFARRGSPGSRRGYRSRSACRCGVSTPGPAPAERLVVELDGHGNRSTPAQIARERRKELALRGAGFVIARYTDDQINYEAALVVADLRRLLSLSARSGGRGSR